MARRKGGVHVQGGVHAAVAVNVNKQGGTTTSVSSRQDTEIRQEPEMDDRTDALTDDELAGETAEALPDREAMSLVNANVAAPVNLAAALNVASDDSIAIANAEQTAPITQTT